MLSAVFTYLAAQAGWRVDCVLTGSMEPALKIGSIVVSRPTAPASIETGDIITFHDDLLAENVITHRVVEVWKNSSVYYQTMGDANQVQDPFTVPARNLIGKVWFSLPLLGYLILFLKTPAGFISVIAVPTAALFVAYVGIVIREIRKARMKKAGEVAR